MSCLATERGSATATAAVVFFAAALVVPAGDFDSDVGGADVGEAPPERVAFSFAALELSVGTNP